MDRRTFVAIWVSELLAVTDETGAQPAKVRPGTPGIGLLFVLFLFFGETLAPTALAGMAIAVIGVALVNT